VRAIFALVGACLLAAGIGGLIHPRWSTPSQKKEITIDNHKVIFESQRYTMIPKAWSGAAIIVGGGLILLSLQRRRGR